MKEKKTRYDKVLSKLPDTIQWSTTQDVTAAKTFLLENDGLPRVFLGSGGSLSAAHLAAQLSVECGIVAVAMTPYQFIFSAWSKIPAKVVIISAGGRNVDAINAYKIARSYPKQQVGVMLMSSPSTLEKIMEEEKEPNRFIFQLHNGDGFLATNSLTAFYSLLVRIFRDETICSVNWSFITEIETQLKDFIKNSYTLTTDDWDEHDAALYEARETDRFYVLYAPDSMPIAIDLESRFSEGSVGCLQISDYRNFAHGRFNWFHQRKGQTAIIALVTPESKEVAENILSELPDDIPLMRLSTNLNGSQGLMDLLLKGMYLSKYLGLRWGLDIGAPKVADFGRIIHKKNFMVMDNTAGNTETFPVAESIEDRHTISDSILELPIENIARVSGHIVRGETLWASRNRKHIDSVKGAGVECIIDFRTADFTDKFSEVCASKGIAYRHFPIDKANLPDEDLLKSLPELFDMLDNRNCYISCQQGMHRTDIALAIYYMFHDIPFVPDLRGHKKNGNFRCDDIMRRINSLYAALTPELKVLLGIPDYGDNDFRRRRKKLLDSNR